MELSKDANKALEDLSNEDIAKLIADVCYMSKNDTENLSHVNLGHLMAVQLLMERVVLTNEDTEYTEEDMALRIAEYIDYMDDSVSMFDDKDVVDAKFTEHEPEEIEDVPMSRD